jgi:hypothetical protein
MQNTSEMLLNQNQTNKLLTASQSFHRIPYGHVQETITRAQHAQGKLVSFDPVTRERYQLSPAKIHTQ